MRLKRLPYKLLMLIFIVMMLIYINNNMGYARLNENSDMAGGGVMGGQGNSPIDRLNPGTMDQQRNKEITDAPPVLPYQLTGIIDRLGDVFVKILEIKKMIKSVQGAPGYTKHHAEVISKLSKRLDAANKIVADATALIDDFQLSSD